MTEIELSLDINELKSIYFGSKEHVYFFGPSTKLRSTFLVLLVVLFPLICIRYYFWKETWLFISYCLLLILVIFDFRRKSIPIIKWKNSVLKYLSEVKENNNALIRYNSDFLQYVQGKDESTLYWKEVSEASLNKSAIWLHGSSTILIPKHAMSFQEYDDLTKLIKAEVMNISDKY